MPSEVPRSKGELNFAITMLMQVYMLDQMMQNEGQASYDILSDTASGCHEAEEEFRRRMIVPYEDTKIEEHGDVYPFLVF